MKYKIREIFEKRKIRISHVAEILGITRVTLSNYVNENKKMPKDTFLKIAEFLGMEPTELLAPKGYKYEKPKKGTRRCMTNPSEGVFLDALDRATALFKGHEGELIERIRPPKGMDHHYGLKGEYLGCY